MATPLGLDLCPLDKTLEQLGAAAVTGDEQAVQQAIDAYTKVAVCLVQAGASKAFGQRIAPTEMATDAFKKLLTRSRTAK